MSKQPTAPAEPDVTLDEIQRRYPRDVSDEEWRRQIARLRMERASWQEKQKKRGKDE